jgi:TonB-dependent receptor
LDGSYNLVTQNGRTIARTTGDRSFNFADLASGMVAGVAVSKTSNATLDSGGMGATVDVKSIRPLNSPGQKIVVSGKMISDSSFAGGDTPEVFGLYSNTFADDSIGVSVALDYQKRESSLARAMIDNGWRTFDGSAAPTTANNPKFGIYSKPQSARYKFEEDERERLNGQVVLQWAPTDNITATLDYDTYERTVHSDRNEVSSWFTFPSTAAGVWITNGNVSSPLIYAETYRPTGGTQAPNDLSMAGGIFAHKYSGDSVGLNVAWEVNDKLKLTFDASNSEASDAADSKYGSDATISTAGFTRTSTSVSFNGDVFTVINGGGNAKASGMQVTGSYFQRNPNDSSVDQYSVKGNFVLTDEQNIDFGIASTEVFNHNRASNVQQNGWGGLGTPGQMTSAFTGSDAFLRSRFDSTFSTFADANSLPGGATLADGTALQSAQPMDHFFDFNFAAVQAKANSLYNIPSVQKDAASLGNCGDGKASVFCPSTDYAKGTDRQTTETTEAVYVQYNFERDIFKADIGVRYETTDVESTASSSLYTGSNWGADTEISFTGQSTAYTTKSASYSRVLPNVDLSLNITDDVVLRASASKSIARPSYSNIAGGVSVGSNFSRTTGYATGSQGNPALLPYESKNLDVSAEWYYADASYVSVGAFTKDISNFIANKTVRLDGKYAAEGTAIHDPFMGGYANQARAALGAGATGQDLRTWIFANLNGKPGVTKSTAVGAASFAGDIIGQPTDPLVRFDMTTPSNSGDDRSLAGLELALQHMFGESGFGTQVNYTAVHADASWDVARQSQDQTPLLGVSDSANLVGFYDKNGWNVRLAYNWRDKFLTNYADGGGQSPQFVNAYYQIDLGISYEVTENLKVSLDGINITSNAYEIVARDGLQILQHDEYGARYALGVSYSF